MSAGARRHGLGLRLSLAFATLVLLVFAALGVYLDRATDAHMVELDEHELAARLTLLRDAAGRAGRLEALIERLDAALVGSHGLSLALVGDLGSRWSWPDATAAELLPLAEQASAAANPQAAPSLAPQKRTLGHHEVRWVSERLEAGWGETLTLVLARDIGHHTDFQQRMQRHFQWAVLAAALITVLLGSVIVRRSLRPLRELARAAGRISAGQLAARLPEDGVPPELAELIRAFNAMLARLEASFQRLSDYSADLAHELRTPIHRLRMQTEVSLGRLRRVEDYRELLAANLEDYEKLTRMIADMLFLAKAEHGLVTPQRLPVPLRPLVDRLLEFHGILAEELDLAVSGAAPVVVGDPLMLERALGNLLANAIRYTPAGGQVRVELSQDTDQAHIAIRNTCPPIPPEIQARLFERFAHAPGATLHPESHGLGLAITRSIIHAHRGEIRVDSGTEWTVFSVRLPVG